MKTTVALLITYCLIGCSVTYQNALCERPTYYEKWEDKCREFSTVRASDNAIIITSLLLALSTSSNSYQPSIGAVTPNVYGPGIGMDATGRPVSLQGGVPGSYVQKPNAYGPGIHMDQYGNPVRY